jgi:hypothetical protein
MKQENEVCTCSSCGRESPRKNMDWTYDRYGNPWKFCCLRCLPRVKEEIADWKFDSAYAGETLEEDY